MSEHNANSRSYRAKKLRSKARMAKRKAMQGALTEKAVGPRRVRRKGAQMLEKHSQLSVALILLFSGAPIYGQDACERLTAAKIPHTTITLAQTVAAGAFNGPPAPNSGTELSHYIKVFRRSAASLPRQSRPQTPTSNSKYGFRSRDGMASWKGSALADSPDPCSPSQGRLPPPTQQPMPRLPTQRTAICCRQPITGN